MQESKIEELAGAIATDEADLKTATEIRTKEQATFEAEEKDLVETVDIPERAIIAGQLSGVDASAISVEWEAIILKFLVCLHLVTKSFL